MLYTGSIMNNQPNLPEEIGFGKMTHLNWNLWRGSLNKGGAAWMFTVYLTDIPGEWLIKHHQDWPLLLRLLIALLPLAASLLYVRGMARWIRGMDELDRRITLGALLFGTTLYLVFNAGWPLLVRAGVFSALNLTRWHLDQMPFYNCTLTICLTYHFSGLGHFIFNRRYR
jgi:hypothetical protein